MTVLDWRNISNSNLIKQLKVTLYISSWNIMGHCIPGLFMLLPKKLELFIAGILISSVVMDSPMWGAMKLWHGLPLWHVEGKNNFATTSSFVAWVTAYYNPT